MEAKATYAAAPTASGAARRAIAAIRPDMRLRRRARRRALSAIGRRGGQRAHDSEAEQRKHDQDRTPGCRAVRSATLAVDRQQADHARLAMELGCAAISRPHRLASS